MSLKIAHDINEKDRTEDIKIKDNVDFSAMLLSENVLKGLKQCGYIQPSPIQLKAIPLGRCGFDLILKAKSGTGKTAVFVITALEMIDLSKTYPQVVILAPTREIAVQIQQVIKHIGSELNGLSVEYFIGGTPLTEDEFKLQHCHIVVGAPGRVKHLIEKKLLDVSQVRLFILDEADKLMEISFQQSINWIYNQLPKRKQVMAISATYPDDLDTFLGSYMLSPTHVSPDTKMPILLGIKQFYTVVKCHLNAIQQMKFKTEELTKILSNLSFNQCLVFSNYQTRAESLSNNLNQQGWPSRFISGQQSQTKRLEAVDDLRKFKCRILSSTDLTARGIDAANVDLVVNYDVPLDVETYLHRMGRAGRYGSYGISITITSEGKELRGLQKIIKQFGNNVAIAKLPDTKYFKDIWHCDFNSLEHLHCPDDEDESDLPMQRYNHLSAGACPVTKDEGCSAQCSTSTELSEKVSDLICNDYNSKICDSDVKRVGEILKSVESQTSDTNIQHNLTTNFDILKQLSRGNLSSKKVMCKEKSISKHSCQTDTTCDASQNTECGTNNESSRSNQFSENIPRNSSLKNTINCQETLLCQNFSTSSGQSNFPSDSTFIITRDVKFPLNIETSEPNHFNNDLQPNSSPKNILKSQKVLQRDNFTNMHGQTSFPNGNTFVIIKDVGYPNNSGQSSFMSDVTFMTASSNPDKNNFEEGISHNSDKLATSYPISSTLTTRESTHYEEITLDNKTLKKEAPFTRESIRKSPQNETKRLHTTDDSINFEEVHDKLEGSVESNKNLSNATYLKEDSDQKKLQNQCKRWKSNEMMTTSEKVFELSLHENSPQRYQHQQNNAMETDEAYQSLSSHEGTHLSGNNSGDSRFLFNPVSSNPISSKPESSNVNTLLTKNLAMFKLTKMIMDNKFSNSFIKDCSIEVCKLLGTLKEEDKRQLKNFSSDDVKNFLVKNKIGDRQLNKQGNTIKDKGPCKCYENIFSSAYDHALDPENSINWKDLLCDCHTNQLGKEAEVRKEPTLIKKEFNSEPFCFESNSSIDCEEEKCITRTCKGQGIEENLFSKAYDRAIEGEIQKHNSITENNDQIPTEPFGYTVDNNYYSKKFINSTSAKADKSIQSLDKSTKETNYISPDLQNFVERRNVYVSYYQHYSNVLAETAPSFNDVNEFRDWFMKWKDEVEAVRDFVQQDIYQNECNTTKN